MRNTWLARARLESLVVQHHEGASGRIRVKRLVNRDYSHYFAQVATESAAQAESVLARAGGLKLGRGFHSLTGLICSSPFSGVALESRIELPALKRYELRTLHSNSHLFEALDLEHAASFSGFGVWAGDKVQWAKDRRLNHYCVYLMARLKVVSRIDYVSQFELNDEAHALLKTNQGGQAFYKNYGNSFISACQEGGECIALFEFDSHSPYHQQQLNAALEKITGAWTSFEPFESALRSFAGDEVARVHLFINGADENQAYENQGRILKLFNDFPSWVSGERGKPSRFDVFCQDYASVIDEALLPDSPWEKNQFVYDQLAMSADRIVTMVHEIAYIHNHPEIFVQRANEYTNQLSHLQQLYQDVLKCAALITERPEQSRPLPVHLKNALDAIEAMRPHHALLEKAPTVGSREGELFDDAKDFAIRESEGLRYLSIYESELGLGLGAYYERKNGPDYSGPIHGANTPTQHAFDMLAGEYLIELAGTFDNQAPPAIKTIEFSTNSGRHFGPYGKTQDNARQFRFTALSDRRIIGFQGFVKDGALNAIGPVYTHLQAAYKIFGGPIGGGPQGQYFGSLDDMGILTGTLKQIQLKLLPMNLNLKDLGNHGQLKFSIISGLQLHYVLPGQTLHSPGIFGTDSENGMDILLDPDEYVIELSGEWLHFPTSFPLVRQALLDAMGEAASEYLLAYISLRTNKRMLYNLGNSTEGKVSPMLRHIMKKRTFQFLAPPGFALVGLKGRATTQAITAIGPLYRLLKQE